MRNFLWLAVTAAILVSVAQVIKAGPSPDQQMRELKQRQKAQRRQQKEQQRSMKANLMQHPTTPEERKRVKKDLKRQWRMLNKSQKSDRETTKENEKLAKQASKSGSVLP